MNPLQQARERFEKMFRDDAYVLYGSVTKAEMHVEKGMFMLQEYETTLREILAGEIDRLGEFGDNNKWYDKAVGDAAHIIKSKYL